MSIAFEHPDDSPAEQQWRRRVGSAQLPADQHPVTLFGNLSTRGRVGTGEDVLIGGLIISGSEPQAGARPREIGPSLKCRRSDRTLLDPTVTIFNDQAQVVADNDDWMATQEAEITGTGLRPGRPEGIGGHRQFAARLLHGGGERCR